MSSYRRPLLGTGLCGGLTTFSTMQVETVKMLEHHHYGLAVGYTAASIVAGLLALYVATALVRRVRIRAMTVAVWAGVVVIGGVGAVLRFLVDRTVSGRVARSFPFGTLVVNLSGALLLGFLSGLALSPHVALLAGTAFVGSYTTFSTWMLETQRLAEERQVGPPSPTSSSASCSGWPRRGSASVDRRPAVSDDLLKLTAYFAERLRSGDRFLADALLDLYGDSSVATSVVLRGIASFGPHHELRSDQSLSVSEDSPIAIAAVDHADKIAPLADRAVEMTTRGLVTLERAQLHARRRAAHRHRQTHRLHRASGPGVRTTRPTTPCAMCCTATDSPVPQSFSASTAPHTGSVSVPGSSVATSTFPS